MPRRKKNSLGTLIKIIVTATVDVFKKPIVLAWIFAVGGLITLAAFSVPKLRAAHPAPSDIQVKFINPPAWLDESLLMELANKARAHLANAPIGRDGLKSTSATLQSSGWFEKINQVRWINNNVAEIDGLFLIPYAKVSSSSGIRFIDAVGRLLPKRNGLIVKDGYHFIKLDSLQYPMPAKAGMRWRGDDVIASLKLLHLFYDKPWASQIKSINLARWTENAQIMFETKETSQFLWGSLPGEERGLEALAEQKIDRLNHTNATYGAIDQGLQGQFDLTATAIVNRQ
tara:strand:- start:637 stop:1494 length:858 start_codon:yes stop_codon:yes gene_type:complete